MREWKGHFALTARTGQRGPPSSKVVTNIPVRPNLIGPFYLISNENFRNFCLNGKRPKVSMLPHTGCAMCIKPR